MNARTNVRTSVWEPALPFALPALLAVGLVLRLAFINANGFTVDVQSFEAWTLSLLSNGLAHFYAKTSFADYPPGYFYILAIVGHLWQPLQGIDHSYGILRVFVKLPAVLADLGVGALIYYIGKFFDRPRAGLGAAALYLCSPATIFISAYWGQVDAVAGGLALLAVYLLMRGASDARRISPWIVGAWIAIAYSLLIKPQAAVILAFFIAFAFTDRDRLRERLASTAAGMLAALAFTVVLVIPFHPTANPVEAISWLLAQYRYGSSVYPVNSANAFNLWAIRGTLWQPDSTSIGFILTAPQYIWGIVLVVAAVALLVWRYVQERTMGALLESCALALLAFFILATRMHERYSFDAVLFCTACIPLARRYLWGALALTVVLFANMVYSLQYLNVVSNHVPNVNPFNLWGPLTQFYALIAVGTFFLLGYVFLGTAPVAEVAGASGVSRVKPREQAEEKEEIGRSWFDPREGLSVMTAVDYLAMALLGVGSFVLSFIRYWYPPGKIFDEIYFARAAEEYLRNMRIYENTHPPFSKLLVTLSVMLFGGLAHGDNAYGWRFLDVLFGAFVVMLLYAFAKRITGSTLFSSLATLFLICDGMHFVQSRIATPEGFVVVFSLAAVYAFYRFLIAAQVEERAHTVVPGWAFAAAAGAGLLAGAIVVGVWDLIWSHMPLPGTLDRASSIIVGLYVALGVYLLLRYTMFRGWFADGARESTFPDGSYALSNDRDVALYAPDGGKIEASGGGKPKITIGTQSQNRAGALVYARDEYAFSYRPAPSVEYETPVAAATYAENEIHCDGKRERGSSATLWLVTFTIALGLLVSSKWYGVMGFGVSFTALILVWAQRYWMPGRPAMWGNPRGFRLDGALATIVFIAATVYALVWVPDLIRQSPDPNEIHNFNDVVYRQYSMFEYHDTLKATHPYSSKWFEWPIDYVPIAYYYQDNRVNHNDPNGNGVEEITSMPNPIGLWLGLIAVPFVGVLAWLRKNKGYALIVLTYLLQWLPWMKSPRITFAYHFYVDIPLICLCNAILMQQIWLHYKDKPAARNWAAGGIALGVVAIVGAFIFFYPILAAVPITWNQWHARMWMPTWIIGPG